MTTASLTARPHAPAAGGVRVTQLRVVRSEWTKLRSLRSTFYTLLAAVVFVIGLGVLFAAVTAAHWSEVGPGERARFDPTNTSLSGVFLAQLAIGVLGVLIVSGEYSTGMIRATLAAVPRRLPVLWAKAGVFAAVTFVLMLLSALAAFFAGQSLLSSKHIQAAFSAPGVARAVVGAALYLTIVGLLGIALGALLRNTAGAIATLFGLLLVLPVLGAVLPSTWSRHVTPYLPSNAGQAVMTVRLGPTSLSPWAGFGVFCAYAAVAMVGAALLLRRRDA